jgi:hypothetical protein
MTSLQIQSKNPFSCRLQNKGGLPFKALKDFLALWFSRGGRRMLRFARHGEFTFVESRTLLEEPATKMRKMMLILTYGSGDIYLAKVGILWRNCQTWSSDNPGNAIIPLPADPFLYDPKQWSVWEIVLFFPQVKFLGNGINQPLNESFPIPNSPQ